MLEIARTFLNSVRVSKRSIHNSSLTFSCPHLIHVNIFSVLEIGCKTARSILTDSIGARIREEGRPQQSVDTDTHHTEHEGTFSKPKVQAL